LWTDSNPRPWSRTGSSTRRAWRRQRGPVPVLALPIDEAHEGMTRLAKLPRCRASSQHRSVAAVRRCGAPKHCPKSGIVPEACASGRSRTIRQGLHKISIARSCGVRKDPLNTATRVLCSIALPAPSIVRLCDGQVGGLASSWRAETRDGRAQAQVLVVGFRALSIASHVASMPRVSAC
jgi:hypothetical protein